MFVSFVCGGRRWAAPAREARRGARPGVVRAAGLVGPRGCPPRPRRGAEPSYPAARRLLRAARGERGPRLPARAPPRLSSRRFPRLPPPTSAEGGRCGLAASRRLGAPGTAVLPAVLPAGARDAAARRLPSGVDASPGGREISPKQCRAGKFHPAREQKQGASSLASMKSESFSPPHNV